MSGSEHPKRYNLDAIKALPILDVCAQFGIDVEKKGRNYWCQLRPENTPSTILHTDSNTFYDFGTQEKGSNIDLICKTQNLSAAQAIRTLGAAFQLPEETSQQRHIREHIMRPIDYMRIGLYGDLATKNFTFPVEALPLHKLVKIQRKYCMSMNQLRKEHPKTYNRILQEKAIPYVEDLKNQYYRTVWSHYTLLEMTGNTYLFYDSERTYAHFEKDAKHLELAERALYKAGEGTGLTLPDRSIYDPLRFISRFLRGLVQISIGERSLTAMDVLSREKGQQTESIQVSHEAFFRDSVTGPLSQIPHSALVSNDSVQVICLHSDLCQVTQILDSTSKKPLDELISRADSRSITSSPREKNLQHNIGEFHEIS